MSKPKTLPDSATDSTITSLSELVRAIPAAKLAEHVEEQVGILEGANVDLDEAAAYYSSLCMTGKRSKSWAPITMSPPLKTPCDSDWWRCTP